MDLIMGQLFYLFNQPSSLQLPVLGVECLSQI